MSNFFNRGRGLFNLPPVVTNILIINVLIFTAIHIVGERLNLVELLGLHMPYSSAFKPHQIITHAFTHVDIFHLLFNMVGLVIFGGMLERLWGGKLFLTFYVVCLLGSCILETSYDVYTYKSGQNAIETFNEDPTPLNYKHTYKKYFARYGSEELDHYQESFIYQWTSTANKPGNPPNEEFVSVATNNLSTLNDLTKESVSIGASGAIVGLMVAFALIFPNAELMLLFLPIPIKAKYYVWFFVLSELFIGFKNVRGDFVGHFAHLGGALSAVLIYLLWRRKHKNQY
jgi:membrane associated rhomboid family serine protease